MRASLHRRGAIKRIVKLSPGDQMCTDAFERHAVHKDKWLRHVGGVENHGQSALSVIT